MGKEGRGEKVNSWGRGKGDGGGDAEVRLRMEKMVEKEKGVKERGKRMGGQDNYKAICNMEILALKMQNIMVRHDFANSLAQFQSFASIKMFL